jgi:hypothetical protein
MWQELMATISSKLADDDDPLLWESVVDHLLTEADYLCSRCRVKRDVFLEIGRCSHWQRPHQHRWLAGGGFAAPFGYGGTGFNIHALPEFEWSLAFERDWFTRRWNPVENVSTARSLVFRVTVPSRTRQHPQAAIHTLWTPHPPTGKRQKLLQLYGFRRMNDRWHCTASSGGSEAYEAAAT